MHLSRALVAFLSHPLLPAELKGQYRPACGHQAPVGVLHRRSGWCTASRPGRRFWDDTVAGGHFLCGNDYVQWAVAGVISEGFWANALLEKGPRPGAMQ